MKVSAFMQQWYRPIVAFATFGIFVMVSDPMHVPSILLVVPFLLLFFALYSTIVSCIGLLRDAKGPMMDRLRRPRVLAALGAAFPVLLLVLKSIGQLSIWDIVTAAAIFIVAYIYISRSAVSLR